MRSIPFQLKALPSSLLLLVLVSSAGQVIGSAAPSTTPALEWPYNLPQGIKYYPEHEVLVKRGLSAFDSLARASQTPAGLRKMPPDPNEMFFLDYWTFDETDEEILANATDLDNGLLPPLLPHMYSPNPQYPPYLLGPFGYRALSKRDFQCPSGYSSCSSINQPNSCCASGSTCVSVPDTGLGPVGCCPGGSSCGSVVGSCNTASGYKSCPDSSNGGCCMPGFDCLDVGCKLGSYIAPIYQLTLSI